MHFTDYSIRLAAYAVVVNERDELLLTWFNGGPRGLEPGWSLPGGGVDFDERIQDAVTKVFDLRPAAIVAELDLLRPIYRPTAAYGHFGRTEAEGVEGAFTWERLDRVDELRAAV